MNLATIVWENASEKERRAALHRPALESNAAVTRQAADIVARVRRDGDGALRDFAAEFENADLQELVVSEEEFAAAESSLSTDSLAAIDIAIANVKCFHEQQKPTSIDIETVSGVRCQRVNHAIDAVGLYVPAGTAPLPSAAVMLAVPASIAGCPDIVLCSPCRRDATVDPAILVAARRSGVSRVFKAGGAQAIAAMAYGTESVPKVEKIFGPGNAWVTAAKTLVAADPAGAAIDMPAGPSELLVIADAGANPAFVAADLLSQAEHGADSQVVLLATDSGTLQDVISEVRQQIQALGRKEIATAAMKHSRFILVNTLDEAIAVSNEYAPEHLILQCDQPRARLASIRNAGSVFLGPWSPEAAGDYCSGTNHVLPTYGAAKRYSGLGVDQFMRHMTVQELSKTGLAALAPAIIELATMEGLDAHANAVRERFRAGVKP